MISTLTQQKLLILSHEDSPRLRYIVDHIAELAGIADVQYSAELQEGPYTLIIAYGMLSDMAHISIPASGLLSSVGIESVKLNVKQEGELPYFFWVEEMGYTFDYDLLSMIFYLLTRYEEYVGKERDQYGRYKSEQSIAVRHGFLQRPVVDLWIKRLYQVLSEEADQLIDFQEAFVNKPSMDIDMPYAYRHKGHKAYTGILRDIAKLSAPSMVARIKYWTSGKDPFDTYEYIAETFAKAKLSPNFFILNRYQQPHDENHLAQSDRLLPILNKLASCGRIGYHPSITSHSYTSKLVEEIQGLDRLVMTSSMSRQHFIKMQMPSTYQHLIDQGISADHSMVYPDRIGYRASTCHPYRWYDLEREEVTSLIIHPYVVMDVTLRYYMKVSPAEAIEKIDMFRDDIKMVKGSFGWIWHNSSLSPAYGWAPWKRVFEHLTLL